MALDLSSLRKAVFSLDALVSKSQDKTFMDSLDEIAFNGIKSGVVQHFEFTYELCWKFMKRWLEQQVGRSYVDGVSRQELFRIAAENLLIEGDVMRWMDYHKARNLTSHTYNPNAADEVYLAAVAFVADAKQLLETLDAKND